MKYLHRFFLMFFLPVLAPAHAQTVVDTSRFHVMRVIISKSLNDHKEVQVLTGYPLNRKDKDELLQAAYGNRDIQPLREKARKQGWKFVQSYGSDDVGAIRTIVVFQKSR